MTAPEDLTQRLIQFGPLKLWSVVVTILGDLCRGPEDRIAGPVLGRLIEDMGLSNQALRVALHRLRRDGWIETRRDGRVSSYALTPQGRTRTEAVRPIIYGLAPEPRGPVHLILADPATAATDFADALPEDAVLASARVALSAGPVEAAQQDALVAHLLPGPLPDWISDAIAPKDLRADFAALAALLTPTPAPQDPRRDALHRLLALHHWRRLRLRHGGLPDLLLGPDWEGAKARRAVLALLSAFPRPAPETLLSGDV